MQETLPSSATSVKPRRSLSQSVYDQMVERILDGHYPVGVRLPTEQELAQGFAVSRVTIRQALLKLREYRLVESLQGSGNYVGGLPLGDSGAVGLMMEKASFIDILELRAGLETQTAALAAQRRSDAHIAAMQNALAAHELAGEASIDWLVQFRRADLEFHEAIIEASSNPILSRLLSAINPLFTMQWMDWADELADGFRAIVNQVVNEHAMIMNAIIARDSDMARVAMQFHLKRAQQGIERRRTDVGPPPALK
jgi:DNA-binding FadR family transcriptional regulator